MVALKEHFSTSIFRDLEPRFWNPNMVTAKRVNAHFLLKTTMIILLFFAAFYYETIADNVPLDNFVFGTGWLVSLKLTSELLQKPK